MISPEELLILPEDPRALDALGELDLWFIEFIEKLPSEARSLASTGEVFAGGNRPSSFRGPSEFNPFLTTTPWLLWELTSPLPSGEFLQLATAAAGFGLHLIVMDHLLDRQLPEWDSIHTLLEELWAESGRWLRQIFPPNDPFWVKADQLQGDYQQAWKVEGELKSDHTRVQWADYTSMIKGKVSLLLVAPFGYLSLTNRLDLFPSIRDSFQLTAIAAQLADDISDWEQDLWQGKPSYFLYRLLQTSPSTKTIVDRIILAKGVLEREWMDIVEMNHALDLIDQAAKVTANIPLVAWDHYLNQYREFILLQRRHASLMRMSLT